MTAPVVAMRDARPDEIPPTARKLRDLAEANGWTVRATYCRGTYSTRASSRVVDSLALRMQRGKERAVAVWNDRRFDAACAWDDLYWPRPLNVTELRALVEGVSQ